MKKAFALALAAASLCLACTRQNSKQEVKVMSFNLRLDTPVDGDNRWDNRKAACIDLITDRHPDVLGIQEGLPHQVQFLADNLPGYAWVGTGRDSQSQGNEYSALFYDRARFEPVASGTFWLSETPDSMSRGWDAALNRIVTWARLRDRQSGHELLAMNTHFDHIGPVARRESARLAADRARQLSGDTLPVLLTGDFNAQPADPLFAPIEAYFQPARTTAATTDSLGTYNGYGQEESTQVIDHIFVRNAQALTFHTVTEDYGVPYVSDHYPVEAQVELP